MDSCGDNLLYRELCYQVMAAAFEVHNALGSGFLEEVYKNALMEEFRLRNIPAAAEHRLVVRFKGVDVGCYRADIVVDDRLILELKAVESLSRVHEAQLLNYLKGTGLKLGLLLNFGR